MSNLTLGLDFGTTNTVMAFRSNNKGDGDHVSTINFNTKHGQLDTIRTVLAMWQDPAHTAPSIAVGRDALAEFSEFPDDTRLIQSIKSYAANPLFRQTMLLNKPHTFAQLMRVFLEQLLRLSDLDLKTISKINVGRPVTFAGYAPDENLALQRYREVFAALGLHDITFVYEPVAAAHAFARRLSKSSTVLIADFGGGTTDFSILRLAAPGSNTPHEVLGVGGIGIAGDQFDYRIVSHLILPQLGLGTSYKSMGGKILELPKHAFTSLARWNELSFLRTTKEYTELQDLSDHASAPKKLKRFFNIVDNSKGLALYDAVSSAKRQLSQTDKTELAFEDMSLPLTRADFESWISPDLTRIAEALATTLTKSNIAANEIDSVFLTGGTSLVPAVRQIFIDQFSKEKIHFGDELISVAKGLSEFS